MHSYVFNDLLEAMWGYNTVGDFMYNMLHITGHNKFMRELSHF